jgi:predicted Zn-dependent protease
MTSVCSTPLEANRRGRLRRGLRVLAVLALLSVIVLAAFPIERSLRAAYHFRRAEQALAAEQLDEAGVHLAECLALEPDSVRFHLRAAQAARRSGLYDFAAEHLETCERLGAASDDMLREWAMLRFQRGEATPYNEQILLQAFDHNHPDSALVLEALARGYMRVYALDHALRALDQWLERRPDSVQARLHRGWVYERLDRAEDAQNDYLAAAQQHPDDAEAMRRLAQVMLQRGLAAEALPWFEQLRRQSPDSRTARLGLARCLAMLGRPDEARPLLEELKSESPAEPAVLYELGKLALRQGRPEEAETWLRQAAERAPHDYQTRYQLSLCLLRLGKEDEAHRQEKVMNALSDDLQQMDHLIHVLRSRPDDSELRCQIGQIFLRRGEESEGVRWLSDVLRLHPKYAAAHQILADHYQGKGDARRADEHRRALRAGS